jgi:hypothetical protein
LASAHASQRSQFVSIITNVSLASAHTSERSQFVSIIKIVSLASAHTSQRSQTVSIIKSVSLASAHSSLAVRLGWTPVLKNMKGQRQFDPDRRQCTRQTRSSRGVVCQEYCPLRCDAVYLPQFSDESIATRGNRPLWNVSKFPRKHGVMRQQNIQAYQSADTHGVKQQHNAHRQDNELKTLTWLNTKNGKVSQRITLIILISVYAIIISRLSAVRTM